MVCAIGEFICDTPLHKGQMGITMATNFGTKIAINAYKCISTRYNENAITYNIVRPSGRGTVHSRPHKIFLHFHDLWTLLNKIRAVSYTHLTLPTNREV